MNDDYLWDGSGEPDPDVEKLEAVLGRLRSKTHPHTIPFPSKRPFRGTGRVPRGRSTWQLAAAAVFVLALVGGAVWLSGRGRPAASSWEVASLEGTPLVAESPVAGDATIAVGQWLETDGVSRARIRVGDIGQVTVEPNTRLRLVSTEQTDHRLALARGTLHASISAPPRLFFVETPSAVAADLGCRYTLEVEESGEGFLRVETGWVSFEKDGRASIVPAGALCRTKPGVGPGTPYFEDASSVLSSMLQRLDFETLREDQRHGDLGVLLAEARQKDTLTLWHLLRRADPDERSRLFERMAELSPPPAGVTREGILQGDDAMLEQWWDDLGFGQSLWRKALKKVVSSLAIPRMERPKSSMVGS